MKKSLSIVLVILVFSVISFVGLRHSLANQTPVSVGTTPTFVPNEVLVKFKANASEDAITIAINAVGGLVKTHTGRMMTSAEWAGDKTTANNSFIGDARLFRIVVPPRLGAVNAIAEMSANPNVEYAEGNAIYRADVTPSDTRMANLPRHSSRPSELINP